MLTIVVDSVEE